jgi:hypothetical protein
VSKDHKDVKAHKVSKVLPVVKVHRVTVDKDQQVYKVHRD